MFEKFPPLADNSTLTVADFARFSSSYAETLQKSVPTAKEVVFAYSAEQAENILLEKDSAPEFLSLFAQVKKGTVTWGTCLEYLMLPFAVNKGENVVALISGADPLFLQKVSTDWLEEIKETVAHQFLLVKQARVDCHTGLLNSANLFWLLEIRSALKVV